jgi:hypothetical protein
MLRYLSLFIFLGGLCLLDWSCYKKCGDSKAYKVKLAHISNLVVETDSVGVYTNDLRSGDTVNYSLVRMAIYFENRMVYHLSNGLGFSAYADCVGPFYLQQTTIDSVKILETENAQSSNVSDQFGMISSVGSKIPFTDTDVFLKNIQTIISDDDRCHLVMLKRPTTISEKKYTIQFFDSDGNVFETTTDPIIITP